MWYKASAPGSMMLLGEYAVLHGGSAVACAINQRITVTLSPRSDDVIYIESARLGTYTTSVSKLKVEEPFIFILTILKSFRLPSGCDIYISADFSHEIGFGSSAAVTVATLAVVNEWLKKKVKPHDLVKLGRQVVKKVQTHGSGTDIAAAVFGGIVNYHPFPLSVEKFNLTCPITVLYCGYKTKTAVAINTVTTRFAHHKNLFAKLCAAIGQCAYEGAESLRRGDWRGFSDVMNVQQGLMAALGVNTKELQQLVTDLSELHGMWGAKISGSGFGDCVLGIGVADHNHPQSIPVEMSLEGVRFEQE
jgi:mevalonate kinase